MHHHEFRWIEEPSAVHPVRGDEVSPLCTAVSQIEAKIRSSKGAVGGAHAAMWRGHALPRTRGGHNHQSCLAAIFSGRCALDDFQRLNRIDRNLVREDFALLV